jgi:hypothetical protein
MAMPKLDGKTFILIWRWYNDALVQGPYSFSIDNVLVTAISAAVEVDLTHSDKEKVNTGNKIFYISDQDGGVIGNIANASGDLGCVSLAIADVGNRKDFSEIPASHSGKVIEISMDGLAASTATYDLTLYYTDEELNDFSNPNALQIINVSSTDINNAKNDVSPNYEINGALLEENSAKQYRAFKGTFSGGSGTFALVSQETLIEPSFNVTNFNVFPTLINNSESLNITNSETFVNDVAIYSITGKRVRSFKFNNKQTVVIPIAKLSTGMYFLHINNDKRNTHKFLVK